MAAVSISANMDERDAKRVRMIAEKEHRSVSNFIANAVTVFSELPKDLRDSLLELRVDEDPMAFQRVARDMSALVARAKFDMAFQRLADQKRPNISHRPDRAQACPDRAIHRAPSSPRARRRCRRRP